MTEEAMSLARPLSVALKLPNGARFNRCALQVNPFAYLARHNKSTNFHSEDEYNKKLSKHAWKKISRSLRSQITTALNIQQASCAQRATPDCLPSADSKL